MALHTAALELLCELERSSSAVLLRPKNRRHVDQAQLLRSSERKQQSIYILPELTRVASKPGHQGCRTRAAQGPKQSVQAFFLQHGNRPSVFKRRTTTNVLLG